MNIGQVIGAVGAILSNPKVLELLGKVLDMMGQCQVCGKRAVNTSTALCGSCLDVASTAAQRGQVPAPTAPRQSI